MFATRNGNVRRNSLGDFESINRNGKIAMKLDEGDQIVNVAICSLKDDVLLASANGQCIRFCAEDVRLFKGRDSDGVRGIRLAEGDSVISMAILNHVEATAAERAAYTKIATALRRAQNAEEGEVRVPEPEAEADAEPIEGEANLSPERVAELAAAEQFVLTVSTRGYGKRSSSYDYRVSGTWRQRHRRYGRQRAQWRSSRVIPDRSDRPAHAGDRRRAADPLPGQGRAHRRP